MMQLSFRRLVDMWILCGVAIAVLIGGPNICDANDLNSDIDIAKTKFDEGMHKISEGDYYSALDAFRVSAEHRPKPIVTFNIAMCQKALFKFTQALETFQKYLNEAGGAPIPDLRTEAAEAIEEMRALIGKLKINGAPPGALIFVDDVNMGATPIKEPIAINPGRYVVKVVAQNTRPFTTTVAVTSGAEIDVNVRLDPLLPDVDRTEAIKLETELRKSEQLWLKVTGWGVVGLGITAGLLGGVANIRGHNKYQEAKEHLDTMEKEREGEAYDEALNNYLTIKNENLPRSRMGMIAGYSLGGIFAISGIVLLMIERRKEETATQYGTVAVRPIPGGISVSF